MATVDVDMQARSEPVIGPYPLKIPGDPEQDGPFSDVDNTKPHHPLVIPKREVSSPVFAGFQALEEEHQYQHQCKICGHQFNDKLSLRIHRKEHETEKHFPCNICGKLYSYHSALIAHKKTHLGHKQFKCEICNCEFFYQSALCAHRKTHSIGNLYDCNICGKVFFYQSSLCAHRKIHTSSTPNSYVCELCGKSFSWLSGLCAHRKNYHQTPDSATDAEGNTADNYPADYNHMQAYHRPTASPKKHKCQTCGKVFSWQSGLCAHRRKQHPELYKGNRYLSLPNHLYFDPTAMANINADIATVLGTSQPANASTSTTNTNNNPFTCEICQESFPNRVEFFTHKIRHRQSVGTTSTTETVSIPETTTSTNNAENMEKLQQMIMFMNTSRILAANAYAAAYSGGFFPFHPTAMNAALASQALANPLMQSQARANGAVNSTVPHHLGDEEQAVDLGKVTTCQQASPGAPQNSDAILENDNCNELGTKAMKIENDAEFGCSSPKLLSVTDSEDELEDVVVNLSKGDASRSNSGSPLPLKIGQICSLAVETAPEKGCLSAMGSNCDKIISSSMKENSSEALDFSMRGKSKNMIKDTEVESYSNGMFESAEGNVNVFNSVPSSNNMIELSTDIISFDTTGNEFD